MISGWVISAACSSVWIASGSASIAICRVTASGTAILVITALRCTGRALIAALCTGVLVAAGSWSSSTAIIRCRSSGRICTGFIFCLVGKTELPVTYIDLSAGTSLACSLSLAVDKGMEFKFPIDIQAGSLLDACFNNSFCQMFVQITLIENGFIGVFRVILCVLASL